MSVVDLRLGIQAHTGLLLAEPGLCGAYCEALEAGGVESVWLPEHAIVAESAASAFPYGTDGKLRSGVEGDRPDPLELLAYLAAFSTNLRLGTGVLIAPLQRPVVLAKRAATVAVLFGGRLFGRRHWARQRGDQHAGAEAEVGRKGREVCQELEWIRTVAFDAAAQLPVGAVGKSRCRRLGDNRVFRQPHRLDATGLERFTVG